MGKLGDNSGWWTVEQASKISGLSPWVIRKLCRSGILRTRKPGKEWQIDSSRFVMWLLSSYSDQASG